VHDDTAQDHGAYSRDGSSRSFYEPTPVPRERLERIVGTIRRAPSAGFSQGQRLVVVAEPERRRAIAEAVEENYYVEQGLAPWISGAAALVVVCTREDDYHDRYRQPDKLQEGEEIAWPVPYWYADAGAAAMLVMLAAIDEGLAAGVFGIPAERMERMRALLELPPDVAIVEVITLGFPAGPRLRSAVEPGHTSPQSSPKRRRMVRAWTRSCARNAGRAVPDRACGPAAAHPPRRTFASDRATPVEQMRSRGSLRVTFTFQGQ